FNNNSLSPSTTYYYKVKAYITNNLGIKTYSDWSNTASATTQAAIVAPTNLAASATGSSAIYMGWYDNSNNETGFEIHRSTSSTGTYSKVGEVGANVNVFNNNSLSPSTTYYYKVKAYITNNLGIKTYSDWSNTASATTQAVTTLTAVIEINKTSGKSPLNVSFSAAKSTYTGGSIAVYYWNFGDGTQGSGQVTTHNFVNRTKYSRVYTVTLMIVTNDGKNTSTSKSIVVNP
ncbi:MAG: PKD domain-containing protein, partial [Candidatus Omnitrophica bacterium]|nr:PKD domain-containing protein [Candidatus Omnitrophota bacterium]